MDSGRCTEWKTFRVRELERYPKRVLSSLLSKCEKVQVKFLEGTSQHTLPKNRIKAVPSIIDAIARRSQGVFCGLDEDRVVSK